MVLETLHSLGLGKNEVKVYLKLLELGEATSWDLIKGLEINSSKVYECLGKLEKKGLIGYVKKTNRKHFLASPPARLLDFIDEKERKLSEEKKRVQQILPKLNSIRKKTGEEAQEAVIYQGSKGYKTLLENMLSELSPNGEYITFASGILRDSLPAYWDIFQKKKIKFGITSYCLWDYKVKNQRDYLAEYHGQGRFLSKDAYLSPADFWVYNDKVILVSYSTKPTFAVLITSRGLANGYREIFQNAWKAAEPWISNTKQKKR